MKDLVCFSIGLLIGAVLMKNSRVIRELQRQLENERRCSNS